MATKNMAYDHPAYQAVVAHQTGNLTGSGGTGTKFVAWSSVIAKSVTVKPTTAGTSNDIVNIVTIIGTSTTTTALTTIGSGATTSTNVAVPGTASATLNQGDQMWVQKGTDATLVMLGAIEHVVVPLANVTQ